MWHSTSARAGQCAGEVAFRPLYLKLRPNCGVKGAEDGYRSRFHHATETAAAVY